MLRADCPTARIVLLAFTLIASAKLPSVTVSGLVISCFRSKISLLSKTSNLPVLLSSTQILSPDSTSYVTNLSLISASVSNRLLFNCVTIPNVLSLRSISSSLIGILLTKSTRFRKTFVATQNPFTSVFTLFIPTISPTVNGTFLSKVAKNPVSVFTIFVILTGNAMCFKISQDCLY